VRVRVGDTHGTGGPATRRASDGLALRFLRGHSERGEERLAPGRTGKADEARVEPRKCPSGFERPREDRVEVDRRGDLPELARAPRLGPRFLEGRHEVLVQPLGPRERLAQELLDGGVRASPPAHDDEQDQERRDEGEARRADGETDGNPGSAVAQKHLHPTRSLGRLAAATVTIIL
jgi:hypothetical protein